MKRFSIVLLSLLLLFAGGASVFASCAFEWGHGHAAHSHFDAPDETRPAASATIHCKKLAFPLGPMAVNAQLQFSNAFKQVLYPKHRIASDEHDYDTITDYPLKFPSYRSSSISLATTSNLLSLLAVLRI